MSSAIYELEEFAGYIQKLMPAYLKRHHDYITRVNYDLSLTIGIEYDVMEPVVVDQLDVKELTIQKLEESQEVYEVEAGEYLGAMDEVDDEEDKGKKSVPMVSVHVNQQVTLHQELGALSGISITDHPVLPLYGISNAEVAQSVCAILENMADNYKQIENGVNVNDFVSLFTDSYKFDICRIHPQSNLGAPDFRLNELIALGNITCFETNSHRWDYLNNIVNDEIAEKTKIVGYWGDDSVYEPNVITLSRRAHSVGTYREPIATITEMPDGTFEFHIFSTGFTCLIDTPKPNMIFLTRYAIAVHYLVLRGVLQLS